MAKPRSAHHLRAVFYPNSTAAGADGPDADGRGLGYTQAWHRTNYESSPFCVPNELVCAEIGAFLRLPIPAFAVTYAADSRYFFSSLDFNFDKDDLPPIEADRAWAKLPDLCTGITLFDILIANSDRHDENLVVDQVMDPKAMRVFDHDQALFGGGLPLKGLERLNQLTSRLGISNGGVTGGNRHCLIDHIATTEHFGKWLTRIDSLPDWFVDDVFARAGDYGLSADERTAGRNFIKTRRNSLRDIIQAHSGEFTAVTEWPSDGRLF